MEILETDKIERDIKELADGLLFKSELEFPIQVYCCETQLPFKNYLLKLSGRTNSDTFEEIPLAYLYKNINSLNIERGNPKLSRYNKLINYLTQNLSDLKIFGVGEREIDLFITGLIKPEKYIILSTKSLETI